MSLKSLQCTKEEFNCGEIHIELSQPSQGSSVFKYTHTAVQLHHHLQSSYLTKLSLYPGNSSSSSSPPPALAPTLYIFLWIQLPKYSASPQGDRGFPSGSVGKNLPVTQETQFDPWIRKIPWRRKWPPTPVFSPRESHGQRSLVGYSPWGHTESDTTEVTDHARLCDLISAAELRLRLRVFPKAAIKVLAGLWCHLRV